MTAIKNLMAEIETLPTKHIEEVINFVGFLKLKSLQPIPETMILSQSALSKDWDSPEEDAAWADL